MPAYVRLSKLLEAFELADSNSEAKRLIKEGAVDLDGEKIKDNCLVEVPIGRLHYGRWLEGKIGHGTLEIEAQNGD